MSQQIMFSEASVCSLGGGVGMMSLPISGPMFLLEGVLPTQEVYLLGGLPIGGVSWRPPVVTASVSFPVEVEFEFRW